MGKLVIHEEKLNQEVIEKLVNICPFNAIEKKGEKIEITAGCK
ncbi:electron transfer flavoprotein subunit alpha, partial [Clostridium sp. ZC22-4]|nr:electron transfer flavoprotein subunit alpha [Clostridium brassicae]